MSAVAVRAALETALNGMSPALATAWEDVAYDPDPTQPWQAVHVMFADARPVELGGKWHEEPGIMQVSLFYPAKTGPAQVETRAELIRSTFKHGTEFAASGARVVVRNVPSIARIDDPAWTARAVRIPFSAFIRRS
jgi:hypothetical protein